MKSLGLRPEIQAETAKQQQQKVHVDIGNFKQNATIVE